MKPSPPQTPDQVDDTDPNLPGVRTWGGVYWFVLGCFVVTVALLAIFTRIYS